MNSLTVIQASQGLAKYIRDKHPGIASNGVVIGHDARYNSDKFAKLAANAFSTQNIPVWHFSESSVTPLVPFSVTYLQAAAGIMVTASHVSSPFTFYYSVLYVLVVANFAGRTRLKIMVDSLFSSVFWNAY